MRIRNTTGDLTVKAIAGTYVVVLGMDLPPARCEGLLGFAIHRTDHTENEAHWLEGMKLFPSVPVDFMPGDTVSTRKHPIQAFSWSDFSAKPDHHYTYRVLALNGVPAKPSEMLATELEVRTEPAALPDGHEVYFNRGAAASQEYARRFHAASPDAVGDPAFRWLSRGLEEALLGFLERATDAHWGLRVAAYEFTHVPMLKALRAAHATRKVDVKIIYHAREIDDFTVDKQGTKHPTQTGLNRAAVSAAKLKNVCTERRAPSKSDISHNKFVVLLHNGLPVSVLTGSTNFSEGAIFGHSNVVHVDNNPAVAKRYLDYWNTLQPDPTKAVLRPELDAMAAVPGPPLPAAVPAIGTGAIFSPRSTDDALVLYSMLARRASDALYATFAFGMHPLFQDVYRTSTAPVRFALMDKQVLPLKDKAKEAAEEAKIIALRRMVENRFAIGGTLPFNVLEHWAKERLTGLNPHVKYLHTKYMLVDPLGDDPIVVSGSANFSAASSTDNDENMLVIRGDTRVADIYFGEFVRLYRHYAFRDWLTNAVARGEIDPTKPIPVEWLDEKNSWWRKYFGHTGYSNERVYLTK